MVQKLIFLNSQRHQQGYNNADEFWILPRKKVKPPNRAIMNLHANLKFQIGWDLVKNLKFVNPRESIPLRIVFECVQYLPFQIRFKICFAAKYFNHIDFGLERRLSIIHFLQNLADSADDVRVEADPNHHPGDAHPLLEGGHCWDISVAYGQHRLNAPIE